MKRKLSDSSDISDNVYNHTRSKNNLVEIQKHPKKRRVDISWVTATDTRNFMINDHIIDWFKLYSKNINQSSQSSQSSQSLYKNNSFKDFIMNKGIEFETKIVDYINKNIMEIVSVSPHITTETIKKTIELMKLGTPIIHSAPFEDTKNYTRGVIDLLVRNDYLSNLILNTPPYENIPSNLGDFHYVVIDIKFSTLSLCHDGIHILNSNSFPAYKTQTRIYTEAIGQIQNFTPRYAYILGRRWKYTSKGVKYSCNNCLDKVGTIDFKEHDTKYIKLCKTAKKWIRDVRSDGKNWSVNPPSRPELFPNMCVDSGKWNVMKEQISQEIGEISSVWYCGIKQREHALKHNIFSWKNPKCNSKTLGIKGKKAPIIDKIIEINKQQTNLILPSKLKTNLFNWKNSNNEIFVDFETFVDVFDPLDTLPQQHSTTMIFMIGIYWNNNGNWEYKNFICNTSSFDEEYRIMNDFTSFIRTNNFCNLWYWYAENKFWNSAYKRQFDIACKNKDLIKQNNIRNNWNFTEWKDMYKIFCQEPIVIKDCFKYSLKTISKAMRKHNFITTKLESDCDSGMLAAVRSWEAYQTEKNPQSCAIIQDIAKYNCFDVKVLWEILTYLRKNHT